MEMKGNSKIIGFSQTKQYFIIYFKLLTFLTKYFFFLIFKISCKDGLMMV